MAQARAGWLAMLLMASMVACAGPNLWTDGTSVSTGTTSRGRLRHPAKLPLKGPGFVVPARWEERGFQYGVDELVAAVQRAAKKVSGRAKRGLLGVADFGPQRGGKSAWHGSHQSGRDVDLHFYSIDAKGHPIEAPENDMIRYDAEGKPYVRRGVTYNEVGWEGRRFDTSHNWELVEALLSDAEIRVQWIFVSQALEDRLLVHATRKKRPPWLIEYARTVMYSPADAPPHEKKKYKYSGPEIYDPYQQRVQATLSPVDAG